VTSIAPLYDPPPAKSPTLPPTVDAAGLTHVGLKRKANEDAFLISTLQRSMLIHDASPEAARGWFSGEPAGTLLIVADGMGGQGGGDVASQVAVHTIATYLLNVMPWATRGESHVSGRASLNGVRDELSSALVVGDSTVKQAGMEVGVPRMGSTLTAAFVNFPLLYVAHVGDTRCSVFRNGVLTQLTTDHTVAQQLSERGEPMPPESHWHNVLWNSLGGDDSLPRPQIVKFRLEPGDSIFLCSDGLTKHVSDEEVSAVLAETASNAERCQRLVDLTNQKGGTDNVTVVIATPVPASPRRA
jgi:serine/threonine protein phosphatase PrpC